MAESKEELKSLLMTVKEESEKAGLKSTFKRLHIKKLYIKMMASVPITSQQIYKNGNSDRLHFLGFQNCCGQ